MALAPNWTPERRAAERAKAEARRVERRAAAERALAAEAAEVERIRQFMEAKFGSGVQFIACRGRGKPAVLQINPPPMGRRHEPELI